MKKILLISLSVLFLASCEPQEPYVSNIGKILQGQHLLKHLPFQKDSVTQNSFFRVVKDKVFFSWQLPDSTYVISQLPLSQIRTRFDPTIEQPFIQFRWQSGEESNFDEVFKLYVRYAIVNCKESDFLSDITLPTE